MSKLTKTEREAAAQALAALPAPALDDPDNPELTAKDLARLAPPEEALPPEVLAAFPKTRVGRPRNPQAKQIVTLRLRPAVLEAYRAQGEDWRARMEQVLAEGVGPRPGGGAAKRRA